MNEAKIEARTLECASVCQGEGKIKRKGIKCEISKSSCI